MSTYKILTAASVMALFGAAASAEMPMNVYGDIGFAIGRDHVLSTDDDGEKYGVSSRSLQGYVGTDYSGWRGTLDFAIMGRDDGGETYFDSFAPNKAAALGLHAGREIGEKAYVGIFVGKNWFQGDDAGTYNSYVNGTLYGLEAEAELVPGAAIYGQYGYADMVGDENDTAFKGHFGKVGMSMQRDRLLMRLEGEWGRSPNIFEDEDDWGEYTKIALGGEYELRPNLFATAQISHMEITANSEDDGEDNSIQLGLKMSFGKPGQVNNLRTPYTPGLAAAWAEVLD